METVAVEIGVCWFPFVLCSLGLEEKKQKQSVGVMHFVVGASLRSLDILRLRRTAAFANDLAAVRTNNTAIGKIFGFIAGQF